MKFYKILISTLVLLTSFCFAKAMAYGEHYFPRESLEQYCESLPNSQFHKDLEYCSCDNSSEGFSHYKGKSKCQKAIDEGLLEEPDDEYTDSSGDEDSSWFSWFDNDDEEPEPENPPSYLSKSYFSRASDLLVVYENGDISITPTLPSVNKKYFNSASYNVAIRKRPNLDQNFLQHFLEMGQAGFKQHFSLDLLFKTNRSYEYAMKGGQLEKLPIHRQTKEEVSALISAYNALIDDQIKPNVSGNCADYCTVEELFSLPNFRNFKFKLVYNRTYGTSIHTSIFVYSAKDNLLLGVAQLSPSNRIAGILTISNQSVAPDWTNEYALYDYPFIKPFAKKRIQLIERNEFRSIQNDMDKHFSSYDENDAHVLVCDKGSAINDKSTREKIYSYGFSPDSLTGWLDNPNNTPALFYDSILATDFGVLKTENYHLAKISQILKSSYDSIRTHKSKRIKIIPVNYEHCSESQSQLIENLNQSNVKVVNYSMVKLTTNEICQNSSFKKWIDSDKSKLFVLAAGNMPNEMNPINKYCPQNLANTQNTILVSQQGLTAGVNYSDIFVNQNGETGSSFSAAKLSGVAAKIHSDYPQLSTAEIRMAILVSGDFQTYFKVRSHSVLNIDRAILAAKYLSRYPRHNSFDVKLDRLLQDLYGEEDALKRYMIYDRNGLF